MDANQRSEFNNQTNNGANEKWTPGSKGNTQTGPLDHTYPQGPGQQQVIRGENEMQGDQDPARMDQQEVAAEDGGRASYETTLPGSVPSDLPGGSMQSQQTGGSGPQQGITDSHQRQMEQRSGAWGLLEQPVGHRDPHSGTDVRMHPANLQGNSQAVHAMNPQDAAQPELQGGSLGRHHGVPQGTTGPAAHGGEAGMPAAEQGGIYGNRQGAAMMGQGTGMAIGPHAAADAGNRQSSTERSGSQTGAAGREAGTPDVHLSNDSAGGLPRSPGNTGPRSDNGGWKPGQSMQAETNPVHESNDAAGGYPKSPAGANRLAGDRKMDDDTGFSRK